MINFDAFFCAFLISYVGINKEAITTVHRRIVLASFIVMMIAFLYLTRRPYVWVYGETTVLIVVIAMVVCFDFEVRKHNERLTKDAIRRNPWRILEAFGATSLAFYIWHYFIIWNMRTFTNAVAKAPDYGAYVPVFISAFVLTCITATVWHLAVERPISRWGK
jgi:peptidoglycan/LPS O-acetylase OafA/YrhL